MARTARGESADTVYEGLRRVVSRSTITRRQAVLRGKAPAPATEARTARAGGTGAGAGALIESIESLDVSDVPDAAPVEDLSAWIKRLEKAAALAEERGNLGALASIAAKVTALLSLQHKTAPLPKLDQNENPDMKALAAKGRATLEKLANDFFANQR